MAYIQTIGTEETDMAFRDKNMSFRDARDMAMEFGAKVPKYDHTSPVAGCWTDRVAWLPRAAEQGKLKEAVAEANRYADPYADPYSDD